MLKAENLHVYYGDAQVLWGIDLYVPAGEIVALVGANGGGKTTFLKAVCGLLPLKQGAVSLAGKDLKEITAENRVGLGLAMVPEGRKIFANMTAEENLKTGAYSKNTWRRKDALLEEVYQLFPRLKERRRQMGGTLSGGEQQMLAIGRALMSDPKILFFDEPSLGLAPKVVEQVMGLIQAINHKGVTVLLVEQNVNMALKIAHQGYVIESGRIVMHDEAEALLADKKVKEAYLGL